MKNSTCKNNKSRASASDLVTMQMRQNTEIGKCEIRQNYSSVDLRTE